jgi:serine protease AprX
MARRATVAAVTAFVAVLGLTTGVGQAQAPRPAARTGAAAAAAAVDPALAAARGTVSVVVVRRPGSGYAADAAVRAAGGTVTRDLSLVHGFAARVPASQLPALAASRGVLTLSLDRHMTVQGSIGGGSGGQSVYAKAVRADGLAKTGNTGAGVTVALIDTGVANLPDLAGRIVDVETDPLGGTAPCVNLSGELGCDDGYGHGTFLAGLIAGNGAASGGAYQGVAPGARIVSVKVAGRDGSADVSGVIAAIQWVVSFRQRYGIKVLNLSLGTDSTQTYRLDPLNFAVERAWAAGITVVVSASNRGPDARTIAKPGDDPWVLTVGALDDRGTAGIGDDRLPNFSSRGPTAADGVAKPDIVAPGSHLVSLSAPGSEIATRFPSAMAAPYRRGSGTSMSTAVVSGAVALMLAANPALTPDRIKFALTASARPAASADPMAVGAGIVDVAGALAAPPGVANVGLDRSTGLGSLDASRGTVQTATTDPAGTTVVLTGEVTAQLLVWDPATYLTTGWDGTNWYGTNWYGTNWYGTNWYGTNWYGTNWYGSSFYGQVDGTNWYGTNWYGSAWYGAWE